MQGRAHAREVLVGAQGPALSSITEENARVSSNIAATTYIPIQSL
jgi:hypothetical protein